VLTALFSAAFGAVVKWVLSCFTTDPKEKLGALEVTTTAQTQELKNVEIKNTIDNRVESASAADIKRLSADLDVADK
jgi:hypothetical protein